MFVYEERAKYGEDGGKGEGEGDGEGQGEGEEFECGECERENDGI